MARRFPSCTIVVVLFFCIPVFLWLYYLPPTAQLTGTNEASTPVDLQELEQAIEDLHAQQLMVKTIKQEKKRNKSKPAKTNTIVSSNPFLNHAFHKTTNPMKLHQYMKYLSRQKQCKNKPIFVSMARAKSPLYMQLIENFFYTMLRFNLLDCAVMVCISDETCVQHCNTYGFPCYNYQHPDPSTHVMRQIGELKLFHMGKALEKGVNLLILDLDVAFLQDPMSLVTGFFENPLEQVRSQTDIGHIQERRKKFEGTPVFGTWFTTPRSNFGLYLVKAHKLSTKTFKCAWKAYNKVDTKRQELVAIDQNSLVGCIKFQRYSNQYNFSIFSLGFLLDTDPLPRHPQKVLLLDKIEHRAEWNGMAFELGGEVARSELKDAVAVHATCYEGYTKLLVLKACNGFYSELYYDPLRRTLTKPLMYITRRGLMDEIRALSFLAIYSNRTLLLPNVLIGSGTDSVDASTVSQCLMQSNAYQRTCRLFGEAASTELSGAPLKYTTAPLYDGEYYWPSFRTIAEVTAPLSIIEPAYYYKMQSDYGRTVPEPFILRFDMNQFRGKNLPTGETLKLLLAAVREADTHPRVVIELFDSSVEDRKSEPVDITAWAVDSASSWTKTMGGAVRDERVKKLSYILTPKGSTESLAHPSIEQLYICNSFLRYVETNRTCFDKC